MSDRHAPTVCGTPGPTITVPSRRPEGERLAQVVCNRLFGHDGHHIWRKGDGTRRVVWSDSQTFGCHPGQPHDGRILLPAPRVDTKARRF